MVEEVSETEAPTNHLGDGFEAPAEPGERRGTHVRKESDYIRRLRAGEGVANYLPNTTLLSKGIQEGSKVGDMVNDESASDDWEMVAVEDFAMATAMTNAEGLVPSYEEAKRCPDWTKWQEAIQKELASLKANKTWTLVECPTRTKVVGCKWVLRIKKNAAGEIEKYKARLVAQGYSQTYGVNYYDTYAPVAKLASFRLLLQHAMDGLSIHSTLTVHS